MQRSRAVLLRSVATRFFQPHSAGRAPPPSRSFRPSASALLDRSRHYLGTDAASPSSEKNNSTETMSGVFKRWPDPVVESRGDYREESHLETLVGGPLYRNQPSLPRLPVPDVRDTIEKLVPTCLPLAESPEERESFLRLCEDFPSQVEELQRRLIERRDVDMSDSSWLQLWWNTTGYLEVRDPVVVNVSYFFHFSDDGTLPQPDEVEPGNSLGIKRGAAALFAASEYRKRVCSGSLPCEAIGRKDPKTPLCSAAFKYMFNACRVPRRGRDTYKMYDPSTRSHAVVARKGRFYAVDVTDPATADPLPLNVIEERLRRVVRMADAAEREGGGNAPMLGWLTSSDRDSWADARAEMIRAGGPKMERALEELESGSILLCLDDEEPISRRQCGELFWTGSLTSGRNRWFDKSVQIFCADNGKSGLLGEHSMMDGMPVVGLADHVTGTTYRDAARRSSGTADAGGANEESAVRDIFGGCADDLNAAGSGVNRMVEKAKSDFTALVSAHELNVQSFQGYGSAYIKSVGYSPDAYVQMAIQLATYRLWGKQAGTYEATQMRPFLHGRTETTRSVSPASQAFVKRMGLRPALDEDEEAARKEKIALLRAAADSHVRYIGMAAKGQAVDRHLLGLSMLVRPGEELPPLYSHPLYQRAKTWRVSTSHLTHPRFDNWGYGEVTPDGVGLSYGIRPDRCVFNITALREKEYTDRLSHLLEEALIEMQILNEMDKSPASRL